ncbi:MULTISPECIES: diol dehydratase small subunit [Lactobacillaceae]|uniref:diol dehydratase small subunit n=1 Tax=Lactobacillaceae TaxID=33958 RepID=UPI000C1B6639|nr:MULTISPECIES: diol dehydratase small subunit [Lactobacillaceae]
MTEIDDLISKIVNNVQDASSSEPKPEPVKQATQALNREMTRDDYPLFQKHPEMVNAPTGKNVSEITLEAAINGQVKPEDLRISSDTLKAQGEIAKNSGREAIKSNMDRAAELTSIPDERLLEMYGSLRPYRSSKQELLDIADELQNKYNAVITANFVREAASEYEIRKKLKGDN